MIPAISIELEKVTGYVHNGSEKLLTVDDYGNHLWQKSDELLRAWAWGVASTGYDDVDFIITFADGYRYRGCVELQHPSNAVVPLLAVFGRIGKKPCRRKGSLAMEEKQIAKIGSFCLNEACKEYKKFNHGNMMKYGKTDTGVQRYRCKTCRKTFTETKGTIFYRLRHSEEEVVECMAMVGDRNSLAAIHRIKGIKEETVCNWLSRAASHVEQFEEGLVRKRKLSRVQIDALWTYVGHKGEKGGG